VQNGPEFEARNGCEEDFRLSKQVFGDDTESRMQRQKGHKGPADTPLPTFIFNPDGQVAVGTKGANSNGGQKPQQTQYKADSIGVKPS
jgi:hypothetical protein